MSRESIPDHQDVAIQVAAHVFEELHDLLGLEGLFEDLEIEIPEGDASDDRKDFPI